MSALERVLALPSALLLLLAEALLSASVSAIRFRSLPELMGAAPFLFRPALRHVQFSAGPQTIGAGEGNRTLVISLEGCCSTIELHPPISTSFSAHFVVAPATFNSFSQGPLRFRHRYSPET